MDNAQTIIFNRIVELAEAALQAQKAKQPEAPAKTPMQTALDKFFSVPRFCEHHNAVTELVGILTGYTPPAKPVINAVPGTILFCSHNRCAWLLLADGRGFATTGSGPYRNEASCERLATVDEATAFIEKFKTINPLDFGNWLTGPGRDILPWAITL